MKIAATRITTIGIILATRVTLAMIAASFTPRILYSVNKITSTMAIAFTFPSVSPGKKSMRAVGIAIATAAMEPGLAMSRWLKPYLYPIIG